MLCLLAARGLAGQVELAAELEVGQEEIDQDLSPQGQIFHADVREGGTHAIEPEEAPDAERGGEQATDGLPEGGNALPGPGDAGEEEEGHGGEYHQQEDAFAIAHQAG